MRKYLYLIILCVVFAGCKGSQQKGNTAESNGKESVDIDGINGYVDKSRFVGRHSLREIRFIHH